MRGEARYQRYDEGRGLGAIASGAFGRVYVGCDLVLGTSCAIKRQSASSQAAATELAFYKSISQFAHPNVMALLDHFSTKDNVYMVFDMMDVDLWTAWEKSRKLLPMEKAHRFLRDLVAGVAHLHSLLIVHADLSMANMLIGTTAPSQEPFGLRGQVLRIADLGGAATARDMVFSLSPGEKITTEYCRAPEIFLGARKFTSAVDIWAIGITGTALLCGSTIFWRQEHHEEHLAGFEPRGTPPEKSILRNQVAAMGPVGSSAWPSVGSEPSCCDLPRWAELASILTGPSQYPSFESALACGRLVRRPVDPSGPAAALLSSWLRWRPSGRLSAGASLGEPFFRSEHQKPPPLAAALVLSATAESLRTLVLHSWWRGMPIRLEDLPLPDGRSALGLPPLPPPGDCSALGLPPSPPPDDSSALGRPPLPPPVDEPEVVRPSAPSQEAGHGPAAAEASGATEGGPGKRRRVMQKRAAEEPSGTASQPGSASERRGIRRGRADEHGIEAPAEQPREASSAVVAAPACRLAGAAPFPRGSCQCRGHCGALGCRRRESQCRRAREPMAACSRPPAPGQDFCSRCKCDQCGLGRQAVHGDGRWCTGCFGALVGGRWRYTNQFGEWKMSRNWPEPLQCAAKCAFITNGHPPEDNDLWKQFLFGFDVRRLSRSPAPGQRAPIGSEPRGRLEHGDVVFVCLVAMAKWPSLLRVALDALDGSGLDPRQASAGDWRQFLLVFLDLCDGVPAKDELKSITPGRTGASFGLIWLCKRVRILAKVRGRDAPPARVYKLGCLQNEYCLLPPSESARALQAVMDAARDADIQFPPPFWKGPAGWQMGPGSAPAPSQVPEPEDLESLAKKAHNLSRAICGDGQVLASGTLARRLLNIVEERYGNAVWDACRTAVLSDILPDLTGNVPLLARDRLAGDFRKRFGMSPLIVSAMACLWSSVPPERRKDALAATNLQLLRAADKCGNPHAQPKDWVAYLKLKK